MLNDVEPVTLQFHLTPHLGGLHKHICSVFGMRNWNPRVIIS